MKAQLTELLTGYGPIAGVWFDGYWDQLPNDHDKLSKPAVDWHLEEFSPITSCSPSAWWAIIISEPYSREGSNV